MHRFGTNREEELMGNWLAKADVKITIKNSVFR